MHMTLREVSDEHFQRMTSSKSGKRESRNPSGWVATMVATTYPSIRCPATSGKAWQKSGVALA
jgi:hypothetical protein